MHPTQLQTILGYLKGTQQQGHPILPPQPIEPIQANLTEGQQILGRMPTTPPPTGGPNLTNPVHPLYQDPRKYDIMDNAAYGSWKTPYFGGN